MKPEDYVIEFINSHAISIAVDSKSYHDLTSMVSMAILDERNRIANRVESFPAVNALPFAEMIRNDNWVIE